MLKNGWQWKNLRKNGLRVSAGAEMEKNNSKSQCDSTERMHYETVPLALQHYCNSWATQPLRWCKLANWQNTAIPLVSLQRHWQDTKASALISHSVTQSVKQLNAAVLLWTSPGLHCENTGCSSTFPLLFGLSAARNTLQRTAPTTGSQS